MKKLDNETTRQYVELVKDRTVERFLNRFFLRDTVIRSLYIISPFIAPLTGERHSLLDMKNKIEKDRIPTYVITRAPTEVYQNEAINVFLESPWIEIRYNPSIHAKLYVVVAEQERESFALFGSGNLTTKSIESNIELGMLIYSCGGGRELLHELQYWAGHRLRTLRESKIVQTIHFRRR